MSGELGAWNYDATLTLNHTWLYTQGVGLLDFNQLMSDVANGTYSFVNPGSNSAAVRAALAPPANKTSTSDLDAFDFTINRQIGQMAGGPTGVALGAQLRHEAQDDPDLNPNLMYQGLGIAHTIGSRNVGAVFGEVDMFPLQSLEVDLSGRYDHYSDFGGSFSPKIGIKWDPIPQLALRGTYSRGFRAPSFSESATSAAEGFTTYGIDPTSSLYAAHHGDAYVANQYNLAQFSIANPSVQPEKSHSYTFGAIVQPTDWFNASADYYNITKTDVIVQAAPSVALAAYLNGQALPAGYTITPDVPDPLYPNATPRPIVVSSPYINANSEKTSGVDLDLRFKFHFGQAEFTSDLNATKILTWKMETPQGDAWYVGTQGPYNLSSGAGTPRYRAAWRNTLVWGPWTGTASVYYVSGLYMSAPDLTGPGCFATQIGDPVPANCRMPSFTDVDLTGSYAVNTHVTIDGGVLNAFDREPPFDPINYAGLNYNPTYAQTGIVGRFFKLGVDVTFQ